MRRTLITRVSAGALASIALAAGPEMSLAQETAGGQRLTFGIETELRAHDNLELDAVSAGNTWRADTKVSFDFATETPVSILALSADTVLRAERTPAGTNTEVITPGFGLSYTRDVEAARFTFGAGLDATEVDGFLLRDDGTIDATDLIVDTGTRYSYGVNAGLEIGRQAPLGLMLDLRYDGVLYDGTSDPGLFDSRTYGGTAGLTFRFSPVTDGRLTLSADRYEAEDAPRTRRNTFALSFGVTHELSEITTIDASVGGRLIDDSVEGDILGADASVTLSRELPRGAISLTLETEQTVAGRRDRAEVTRRFDFPLGVVTASLGAVNAQGITVQPVGSLAWAYEFRLGQLNTELSHDVGVNSDADIQRTTAARLDVSFDLTNVSSLSFNADFTYIDGAGTAGVADTSRGNFGVTYRHDLTEDWALSAGYERRYFDDAGASPAWDNAVFVTLGRTFSLLR